jgi:hypothetical protein
VILFRYLRHIADSDRTFSAVSLTGAFPAIFEIAPEFVDIWEA